MRAKHTNCFVHWGEKCGVESSNVSWIKTTSVSQLRWWSSSLFGCTCTCIARKMFFFKFFFSYTRSNTHTLRLQPLQVLVIRTHASLIYIHTGTHTLFQYIQKKIFMCYYCCYFFKKCEKKNKKKKKMKISMGMLEMMVYIKNKI